MRKNQTKLQHLKSIYLSSRDDFLLEVLPSVSYSKTPNDIINFRQEHFFGSRLRRAHINKILNK